MVGTQASQDMAAQLRPHNGNGSYERMLHMIRLASSRSIDA